MEWRGISLWCAALSGMNGSGALFGFPCGSFPTCCLTLPLGLQVVLFSSLLAAGTAAGTTGDVGGPTRTTPATASLVSIGRCPVVELAAKGEGAPAGAVPRRYCWGPCSSPSLWSSSRRRQKCEERIEHFYCRMNESR